MNGRNPTRGADSSCRLFASLVVATQSVGALFLSASPWVRGGSTALGARRDRAEVVAITIVLYWIAIELRHVDRRRAALGCLRRMVSQL